MEILREADPDCSQQQLDRFYKRLTEIMSCVSITDDAHTNIIQVLRKIEEALNFHCAARNFLADRFKRLNQKIDGMDIEQFEAEHRKSKKEEERGKKQKADRERALEKKDEQRRKAVEALSKSTFQGKKQNYRSTKPRFKAAVKKQDNLDQQTKDEKEYLGAELFEIMKRPNKVPDDSVADQETDKSKAHTVPKFGSTAKAIKNTVE